MIGVFLLDWSGRDTTSVFRQLLTRKGRVAATGKPICPSANQFAADDFACCLDTRIRGVWRSLVAQRSEQQPLTQT
jgi:hypothetical protein